MSHQFFIPTEWITPPTVTLHGETARQIRTVLRMRPGDEIIVLDNSGMAWSVELTEIAKNSIYGQVITQQPARAEPALQLTLYQGTLKGQKFEWVLQKGTELGIASFAPIICQRSIIRDQAALAKKYGRWKQIIREAAEQSGRGKIPQLEPATSLVKALKQLQPTTLLIMPWEKATQLTLKEILGNSQAKQIALFIGPEGGFSAEEADLSRQFGAHLVKLGPRILRAETAALAASAAIFYEFGEWS